jgi:hypothetical protein
MHKFIGLIFLLFSHSAFADGGGHSYATDPNSYHNRPETYGNNEGSYGADPRSYHNLPESYQNQPGSYQNQPSTYRNIPGTYGYRAPRVKPELQFPAGYFFASGGYIYHWGNGQFQVQNSQGEWERAQYIGNGYFRSFSGRLYYWSK